MLNSIQKEKKNRRNIVKSYSQIKRKVPNNVETIVQLNFEILQRYIYVTVSLK